MRAAQVLMATNRPDTLDPALLRPGRLDRKVEFGLPDLESRTQIFQIHTRTMNCERDIRYELLARCGAPPCICVGGRWWPPGWQCCASKRAHGALASRRFTRYSSRVACVSHANGAP